MTPPEHPDIEAAASVVHIAGIDIRIGHQLRQRCAWCGYVLIEYDLTRVCMAVGEGEEPKEPKEPPTWPAMGLVEVTEGNPRCSALLNDADELPENACIYALESRVL